MEGSAYMLEHLNEKELGLLAARIVLAVGMTPNVVVVAPGPVEGVSWRECYERGLERMARPLEFM
jgi:hypothetical protein